MIEFYAQIRWVHVACVVLSGGLFAVRGALVQLGRGSWALSAPARYLSWTIDTTLLTAALMLATILPSGFFANGWLLAKIVLLVVYIGLATIALRNAHVRRRRWAYIAALLVFAVIVGMARAHHPWGFFAEWLA